MLQVDPNGTHVASHAIGLESNADYRLDLCNAAKAGAEDFLSTLPSNGKGFVLTILSDFSLISVTLISI